MQRTLAVLTLLLVLGVVGGPTPLTRADPPYMIYMPVVSRQIALTGIEVTQAIQTATNSVPMVANRGAVVRVYVAAGGPTDNVTVRLRIYRNGNLVFTGQQTKTAPPVSSQSNYNSTYNYVVPSNFIQSGTLTFTADITNPANTATAPLSVTLQGRSVPNLDLRVVPINYRHTNGVNYPGPTTDSITGFMIQTLPVPGIALSWRTAWPGPSSYYAPAGGLWGSTSQIGNNWSYVLGQMNLLKNSDGAPSKQVYYGLIPAQGFGGGYAGFGYINWRVSIGLNYGLGSNPTGASTTATHEVGHNMGRYHVKCTGTETGVDNAYPYPDGTIGYFGMDIFTGPPTLKSPAVFRDMMSYCNNEWISDYTYLAMMNNQIALGDINGGEIASPSTTGLLISADVSPNQPPTLRPVYSLSGEIETAVDSPYEVVLLGENGAEIGRYPVNVLIAEEYGFEFRHISALVPHPGQAVARVQLFENNQLLTERQLMGSTGPAPSNTPHLESQSNGQWVLRWGPANVPAIVRYTIDGGQSYTTLALDYLGGELPIDVSSLPGGTGYFEVLLADLGQPLPSGPQTQTSAPSLTLPDQPPQVWIVGPDSAIAGHPVLLSGQASDPETGALPDESMQWWLNGEPAGQGRTLLLSLPVGQHTVVLAASDPAGQIVQAAWVLTITD